MLEEALGTVAALQRPPRLPSRDAQRTCAESPHRLRSAASEVPRSFQPALCRKSDVAGRFLSCNARDRALVHQLDAVRILARGAAAS
jgi:hypothetical protein